ncbi:MAG TPA: hypothetical protein VK963_01555 [Candidatus Saccharimonadales bacterium]|nr:hypothetical protein [Candidatus Saccharimonadales bacterium]
MQVPISMVMYEAGKAQKIGPLDLEGGQAVILCQPSRDGSSATQEEVTICAVYMCNDCGRLRVFYHGGSSAHHGAAIATNGDVAPDVGGLAPGPLFSYFRSASSALPVTTDAAVNGREAVCPER